MKSLPKRRVNYAKYGGRNNNNLPRYKLPRRMPLPTSLHVNDVELVHFGKKKNGNNTQPNTHPKYVNNCNQQPVSSHGHGHGMAKTMCHKRRSKKERNRLLQIAVFNFLEKPRSGLSVVYHSVVFLLILASLTLSVLATVDKFQKHPDVQKAVIILEVCLVVLFTVEYLLRFWSCSSHGTYSGCWGKMKFVRKPYMVIDLIVIIATVTVIVLDEDVDNLNISVFRFLRFLQVLRILRVDRQRGAFKMVSQVVYEHRQELLTCWYMSFIILITCSFLVYLAERTSSAKIDGKMENLADGIYWGIISLLTIGYGDISPQTWVAKLITCVFSLLGTAFFALPAGILGSGFALQVAAQQRQKHYNRRRIPAAILIQVCWRRYACTDNKSFRATWTKHLTPIVKRKNLTRESSNKDTTVSPPAGGKRLSAFRRTLVKLQTRALENESYLSTATVPAAMIPPSALPSYLLAPKRSKSEGSLRSAFFNDIPDSSEDEAQATIVSLPSGMGNRPTLAFPTKPKVNGVEATTEKQHRHTLTYVEKSAIRFIREIKFQLALRKFREATQPYDVKDVIEQYTAGQTEMFGYIKKLQLRLETALGFDDDDKETVGEMNIYGRLTTLEHKVETLDKKLDLVIKLLRDERRSASFLSGARSASFCNTLSPEKRKKEVADEKPPIPKNDTDSTRKHKSKSRFKVTILDHERNGTTSDPANIHTGTL